MKDWVQALTDRLREAVESPSKSSQSNAQSELVAPRPATEHRPAVSEEPPVVARLVVEIRSDGTRTVARGAMEDLVTGQRTKVEASGGSPVQLAASLAGSLITTPKKLGDLAGAVLRSKMARRLGKKP